MKPLDNGSLPADSEVDPSLQEDPQSSVATEQLQPFVPPTDLARKLWALRQKYIAEGGRLYSIAEIQQELVSRRREF